MLNGHKSASDLLKDVILQYLGATGKSLQKIKLGRGAVGKIAVISILSVFSFTPYGPNLYVYSKGIRIGIAMGSACIVGGTLLMRKRG